jgi:hypothetical protein
MEHQPEGNGWEPDAFAREHAKVFADELLTMVLDNDPNHRVPVASCTAVMEAVNKVLPVVLNFQYDVWPDLAEVLRANKTLGQVNRARAKLKREKALEARERHKLERQRELLKRDSDKVALIEHVERLEWRLNVDDKRFNEAYDAFKQFRTLFRELMPVIRKFPDCYRTFVQNMMENHDDVLKWLTEGRMRLSFENEGTSKLGYQT